MKLIVGLGNPGPGYEGTRHNVGFEVVDVLARRWGMAMYAEKFHGWFEVGRFGADRIALLKPTTFMNRSGGSVLAAGRFYKLELEDLLVISDDHALPLGRLRMRASGSAGGHNGLSNVIDRLGSDEWSRLRIGIGEPLGDASAFVTGRFHSDEQAVIEPAIERAADAVECWIENGPDLTMTRFNGDAPA